MGLGDDWMNGWMRREQPVENLCAFVALCENQEAGVGDGMSENWRMIGMIRMGGRAEDIIFETRSFVRYESGAVGW